MVHVLKEPGDGWTGRQGLVDAKLIAEVFDRAAIESWLSVLCGPPKMLTGVEEALVRQSVAPHRILSERFQYD